MQPLIKDNGQSIAHIWAAHKGGFPCSERTFYRYVDPGVGEIKNLDLARLVLPQALFEGLGLEHIEPDQTRI